MDAQSNKRSDRGYTGIADIEIEYMMSGFNVGPVNGYKSCL